MSDPLDSVHDKVQAIFSGLAPERFERLDGGRYAKEAYEAFSTALTADHSPEIARELAFHLTDWNWDAAFLVAVHLFPEKFTPEELSSGAEGVLIHAPNHLAAAAQLGRHPVEDIFHAGVSVAPRAERHP